MSTNGQLQPTTTDITRELAAIEAGILAWITAVESRDNDLLPRVVTQAADSVWIGAGADEWLAGYDMLEQAMRTQNEALDDVHIDVSDQTIHVSPQGDMAWATNRWVFKARVGDEEMAMPLRCTWVLASEQGRWTIVHFHKSMGLSG